VLHRLQQEYCESGRIRQFDSLKQFLAGRSDSISYGRVAEELETTVGAVKVSVHRLRRRYRQLLREEIARTVDADSEVEAEMQALFAAVSLQQRKSW